MRNIDTAYIGGQHVPTSGETAQIKDSATEEVVATVRYAARTELDAAVAAAVAAQQDWASTSIAERSDLVRRLADAIDARAEDFARAAGQDVGTTVGDLPWHGSGTTRVLREAADVAEQQLQLRTRIGTAFVEHHPVGTVASLTPWNVPLMMINCKVAPALLTGNTVVLKHSEVAPQAGALYAEVADTVGVPAGVLNILTGDAATGSVLTEHPDVDMVAFTGSTATGRRIMASAAGTLKKVLFELGGKSAHLVLADADLARAVAAAVGNTFRNNGQLCLATARLLVPRHLQDQAVQLAAELAEQYVVGDPRDPSVTMGPLATGTHRDRVQRMIRQGMDTGATLVTGGPERPAGLDTGYFVRPTVLRDVPRDNILAQEEIFGPVLTVLPYDDEDDAVELANGTPYGLWGAVWSQDVDRANRVARRLRAGGVEINDSAWDPRVPTGGFKQSGFSREGGLAGLHEYLLSQALFQPAASAPAAVPAAPAGGDGLER